MFIKLMLLRNPNECFRTGFLVISKAGDGGMFSWCQFLEVCEVIKFYTG